MAQFCVIRSLKLASASVVVPYQYTLIVWSVVFGWLMFAELPDAYTVAGAAIIIAAGLYIFWREQVKAREAAAPAQIAVTVQAGRSSALAGIGLMSLGVFLFCVNDAIGKWLVATYPVGEFLLIRSAATLILLAPFIWRAGRAVFLGAPRPGLQLLRDGARYHRSRAVLLGGRLSAARRRDHVLSGRADLRHGALRAAARREGRLAALARGARRFRRRADRAAALGRDVDLAGADRACRKRCSSRC